jgi:hypothetical protein
MHLKNFTSLLSAVALTLTLSACDSGETKKTETKVTKKTETKVETKVETKGTDTKTDVAVAPQPKPDDKPAADSPEAKVQLAASIAREISAAPEQADDILGKHNLDRDKFDAMIFEIAGDPALTKAYMAARKTS